MVCTRVLPVALTPVSVVAATSARWKDDESENEKETKPSQDPPAEDRQGSANATRTGLFGKGLKTWHYFCLVLTRL